MLRIEEQALTFDDVLLVPQYSSVLPQETDLSTKLTKEVTLKINTILSELFLSSNLILVDFKVEFGICDGKLLLADEFTPDGCRLWDTETLAKMDKDRFRQGLGDVVESYHQVADRLGMNIKLD